MQYFTPKVKFPGLKSEIQVKKQRSIRNDVIIQSCSLNMLVSTKCGLTTDMRVLVLQKAPGDLGSHPAKTAYQNDFMVLNHDKNGLVLMLSEVGFLSFDFWVKDFAFFDLKNRFHVTFHP